ncbi:MAG TPA: molybdopterin-dependent oxidoreductase [Candidatus Methylomirabilis sp.]|nr:molybdopterin-dependent oxidoreductase [Candidatus Methylomirabilis sp.]
MMIRTVCAHDCPDMCSILAHVENGRLVKVQGDPDQPFTAGFVCAKVNREPDLVHSPDRVRTPLRRIGAKGEARFSPITWDEALDEIVLRWQAIMREDGPLAILGYCYSAHQGQTNRWLPMALFHVLGTTRLIPGTVCDSCSGAAWEATLGDVGGADPESVVDSDLIVAWSCDLVTTAVHSWAKVEEARRAGATLIVVDPRRSRTAAQADWHVQPRVGTDAALALGLMHVLARDGLVDRQYVARHTIGFDRLEGEVLPRFSPERVESITGVARGDVERLAHRYGRAHAPFIRIGFGMSRSGQGGQATRAVALLPGVTGAYARRGGGALLATGSGFGLDFARLRRPAGPASTRLVNHSRLGEALLTLREPPIRALFVAANNPAVTCPDVQAVRRGLSRQDLFTVVHDPFISDTARYADIVLPATTYLETEDFFRAYGAYYMQFGPRAVPPQGEARSNRDLAQELARRLGVTDPIFSMTTDELVALMFEKASGPAATIDPGSLRAAGPVKVTPYPAGQTFATPSGKLEFYSALLADQGLPPMPDWVPEAETAEGGGAGGGRRWPLQLLTAPGYFQSHTAFSGNRHLRRRAGTAICILHPDDAVARGLEDGDPVDLVNDRGSVGFELKVSDEVLPGVVLVPGQRPTADARDGTVNVLCSDRYSDLGDGATYQDTRLEVRRALS